MRLLRVTLLVSVLAGSFWLVSPAAAHAAPAGPVAHTVPAANEVLAVAPTRIEILPAGAATSGTATVVDHAGRTVAQGRLARLGGGALDLPLPELQPGVYLVSWSAGLERGAFGFDVTGGAASPAAVVQPRPSTPLGPIEDNLVEWVPIVAIMTFVGALALRFLVSAPAARRSGGADLFERTDRRLTRVAAAAIVVFGPTSLAQLAYADGRFDFAAVWPSLGADGDGHVVGARLALTGLAAVAVVPIALRRRRPPVPLLAAGLGCGLAELALREMPTAVPADWPRTLVNTALYVGHLWGAGIWIGGLVGLLTLALFGAVPAGARRAFWPTAIRRFSVTAMTCVGVLVLSGLWLYWVHVDGVHQLVTTMYGRTLLVKLVVMAVLVLIGASNQLWLMPLLNAHERRADHAAITRTVARHFRLAVAAEIVLGVGVLFVAPLLSGSARNQAFQAGPAALTRTPTSGDARIELTPSGQQPGLIDYTLRFRGGLAPRAVTVSFAARDLGGPAQSVSATALGDGTCRVSGYYTPVVGDWQVTVRADGAAPTTFTLPITAKPPKLPKAPTAQVRWTTWAFGAGETLLVTAALVTSYRVSRRVSDLRLRAATPARPEPGLVGA